MNLKLLVLKTRQVERPGYRPVSYVGDVEVSLPARSPGPWAWPGCRA